MEALHGADPLRYKVAGLCRLFGVTKQAYYKTQSEAFALSSEKEMEIAVFCHAERSTDPLIGCRKLWILFVKDHWAVSRRVFEDVLRSYGLMLKIRRRSTRTTNSLHGLPVYPNLVYNVIPQRPCQVWVADITYVTLRNPDGTTRFCYLSVVMDAYSRYILGYYAGMTLETVYYTIALTMAIETSARLRLDTSSLIHHSDRGVQYASAEYVKILNSNHIGISMTENGNPKDNPQAERINSTIKNELLNGMEFSTIDHLQRALAAKIPYYNERRPYMSLSYLTPLEALGHTGVLEKKWHSYRDEAIEREKGAQKQTT